MEMKNCSTARKMMGVLERQQCGYWWRYSSTPKRLSSFSSMEMMSLLASKTCLPTREGTPTSSGVLAVVVHGGKDGQSVLAAYVVVVRPVAGSDVHGAGAGVRGHEVRQDDF